MTLDISWQIAFPTLSDGDYKVLGRAGLKLRPETAVRAVADRSETVDVARSLVAADVLPWDCPLVTSIPGLWLAASGRIETDSTRLANVLRRLDYKRWVDAMLVRPDEFVLVEGVGIGTGRELLVAAVEAALAVLSAPPPSDVAPRLDTPLAFADALPARLRAHLELAEAAGSTALAAATGEVLIAGPDELRREPLGNLFPDLSQLERPIPTAHLSASLASALDARGWTTWADLSEVAVRDVLALPSVGTGKATDLLTLLASAWLENDLSGAEEQTDAKALRALKVVAAWAAGEHQTPQLGTILTPTLPDDVPQEVVDAVSALGSLSPSALAGEAAERYSVRERVRALCDELDERALHILRSRVLTHGRPPTLEEVGDDLGLTRERVRQIQQSLVARLVDRTSEDDMAPLLRRARRLRRELGVAAPKASIDFGALARQVDADDDEFADLAVSLMLWLAGPYVEDDGWLVVAAERTQLEGLGATLVIRATDGIIPWDVVSLECTGVGLRRDVVDGWLERVGGFRPIPDGLLPWAGSVTDKCQVLLQRLGHPATVEALIDEIDEGYSVRSVRNRLFEDPRFVRTSKTEIGLREWGVDEYTSVVVEMAEEIERRGGRAELANLAATLADRYGVSRSSVNIYATSAPMFRTSGGVVRLRRDDEPVVVEGTLETTAGCYVIDGRWSLRVDVDVDLLRGSGRTIPAAFSDHVGVLPGGRKEFSTAYGEVVIAWPLTSAMGPSFGSLREEAASLRAERGDLLFIRYLGSAGFDCRLLRREMVDGCSSREQLCLLVGEARLDRSEDEAVAAVAASLGLEKNREMTWVELRTALVRRGEQRLAALIRPSDARSEEEALERLWNALQ